MATCRHDAVVTNTVACIMHDSLLRKLDLNLLVALDVLLSVEHISAAAEELGVKQAALQFTLRRLREVFDDQLLIVDGDGGLVQTAKAQVLAEPLEKALVELRHVLGTCATFQPGRARHHFVLACDDFSAMLFLPRLLAVMADQAPNLTLEILPVVSVESAAALEAGRLDMVLQHGFRPTIGTSMKTLLSESLACACRRGHPGINDKLDADSYYSLPHMDVLAAGGLYQRGGLAHVEDLDERQVALSLPNLSAAATILSATELLLVAPRRCLDVWAQEAPLDIFAAPVALPAYAPAMAWQKRSEHHPAHRWLRRTLDDIARKMQ